MNSAKICSPGKKEGLLARVISNPCTRINLRFSQSSGRAAHSKVCFDASSELLSIPDIASREKPPPKDPKPFYHLDSRPEETNRQLFNILLMISNRNLQQRGQKIGLEGLYSTVQGVAETPSTAPWNVRGREGLSPAPGSSQTHSLRPCRFPQEVNMLHFNPKKTVLKFQLTRSLLLVTSVRHKVDSGSNSKQSSEHGSQGASSPAHLVAGGAFGKTCQCSHALCREIPQTHQGTH